METNKQFCTFMLNNYFFGIEVKQVQEVIRFQQMTEVPLTSSVIRGLINLRGQIVTAIDMRRRLNFEDFPENQKPFNVVIRHDEDVVDLLVDQIGDVMEVSQELFEAPPETLKGVSRELIDGAYKLKDKLLLILNIPKVLQIA